MKNKKQIYILGAGSMARETYLIYKNLKKDSLVLGFLEDKPHAKFLMDKPVYSLSRITSFKKNVTFVPAIGSPLRKLIVRKIEKLGFSLESVIHPSVPINQYISIQKGSIICPGVIMTCDIKIGKNCIVNINSLINHDAELGDFVTIGPGANIAGNVKIGKDSWIGVGVTIIDKIKIGEGSFIGAGAVVTKNIPPHTLAYGVPARSIRKISAKNWKDLI
ncbi:hypothetical protein A2767_05830 [Candidatus Roizmanbacteria bacterium RIFCSPHIGHO2_01_FULL_35_10]|uniref:Uncharacterized protein n=1 Tax=Candidatus Roizmanbacteria bacterium RIFCSPLOWO2_01_FULL_35_13 TaxID=1802055 RepID=A0A1F7I6W0_9BACT|nr:MAG: hypothetical protein A2767_05830 [Candidatus Roizmanbacteria bacterium RIFCSPHIGHO2_01_FULL_35_10]OGK39108.1 MAG: hypothetical protein A3A74_05790 [Candidatus Roizmanbacteria bacterium RIFCSPLOWO2_01_FULL_35_13]